MLERQIIRRIVADLSAELPRSQELRTLFERFQADRRSRAEPILGRAVIRGDLPHDLNTSLALDLLAAPVYWRMIILRDRADDAYLEQLTTAIVLGIGASVST